MSYLALHVMYTASPFGGYTMSEKPSFDFAVALRGFLLRALGLMEWSLDLMFELEKNYLFAPILGGNPMGITLNHVTMC